MRPRPPTSMGPGTFWRPSRTKSCSILKPYFSSSSPSPVSLAWPIFGWAAISGGIPCPPGVDITMPSTRKIAPLPFIKKASISWRPLSSKACFGPPTTSASTSPGMLVVDGLMSVASNSCSMACFRNV